MNFQCKIVSSLLTVILNLFYVVQNGVQNLVATIAYWKQN